MSSVEIPATDLKLALLYIRNFRRDMSRANVDPRAVRVALKFALMVDNIFASRHLTREQDAALTRLAREWVRMASSDPCVSTGER